MGPIQFLEIKLLIPESALTTDSYSKFFILFFLFPPPSSYSKFEPPKEPQVSGRSHKTPGPEEPPEVRYRAVGLSLPIEAL